MNQLTRDALNNGTSKRKAEEEQVQLRKKHNSSFENSVDLILNTKNLTEFLHISPPKEGDLENILTTNTNSLSLLEKIVLLIKFDLCLLDKNEKLRKLYFSECLNNFYFLTLLCAQDIQHNPKYQKDSKKFQSKPVPSNPIIFEIIKSIEVCCINSDGLNLTQLNVVRFALILFRVLLSHNQQSKGYFELYLRDSNVLEFIRLTFVDSPPVAIETFGNEVLESIKFHLLCVYKSLFDREEISVHNKLSMLQYALFKNGLLVDEFCCLSSLNPQVNYCLLFSDSLSHQQLLTIFDELSLRSKYLNQSSTHIHYTQSELAHFLVYRFLDEDTPSSLFPLPSVDISYASETDLSIYNNRHRWILTNCELFGTLQYSSIRSFLFDVHLLKFNLNYFQRLSTVYLPMIKKYLKPVPSVGNNREKFNYVFFNYENLGSNKLNYSVWSKNFVPVEDYDLVKGKDMEGLFESEPAVVDISINITKFPVAVREGWESLEEGETLYLISAKYEDSNSDDYSTLSYLEKLIGCTFIGYVQDEGQGPLMQDEYGKPHLVGERSSINQNNYVSPRGQLLSNGKIVLRVGSTEKGFDSTKFNLLLRVQPSYNNFKEINTTMRALTNHTNDLNENVMNLILGYASPEDLIWKSSFNDDQIALSESSRRLDKVQLEACKYCLNNNGLLLVEGLPGTGKTEVLSETLFHLLQSSYHETNDVGKILLISRSSYQIDEILSRMESKCVSSSPAFMNYVLKLGYSEDDSSKYTLLNRVKYFQTRKSEILEFLQLALLSLDEIVGDVFSTLETSWTYYETSLYPNYINNHESFPFKKFYDNCFDSFQSIEDYWRHLFGIFDEIRRLRYLDLIKSNYERAKLLLEKEVKLVCVTATNCMIKYNELVKVKGGFRTIIFEDAHVLDELPSFTPLTLLMKQISQHKQDDMDVKEPWRVIMYGNVNGGQDISLFRRMIRLGIPKVQLKAGYRFITPSMKNFSKLLNQDYEETETNGEEHNYIDQVQVVDVSGVMNNVEIGEEEPRSHYYQNIGEAEYLVAYYQYLRICCDIESDKIAIVTGYQGQAELIRDVVNKRCTSTEKLKGIFGHPGYIGTIDGYLGKEMDYVLVSLVRSKGIGMFSTSDTTTIGTGGPEEELKGKMLDGLSKARKGMVVFCYLKLWKQVLKGENKGGLKIRRGDQVEEYERVEEFSKFVYGETVKRLLQK